MKIFFNETIEILNKFIFIIRSLISSEKIYYEILKHYKGYGLKFSSFVILIVTLISVFGFLINVEIFENKLTSEISSSNNITYIDYITNQFPEIHYDGKNIEINENNRKIFIKNNKNIPIIVLDIDNQLKATEKKGVLLIFKKSEITFPKLDYIKSISYKNIFGSKPKIITNNYIKDFVLTTIQSFKTNIFFSIPVVFLISFTDYIIENAFIIIFLYIICRFMKINLLFKDIFRVVLFASGPSAILSAIIVFTAPFLIFLASSLKFFCLFLLYKAISNIRSQQNN